jgi:hypothetical protein
MPRIRCFPCVWGALERHGKLFFECFYDVNMEVARRKLGVSARAMKLLRDKFDVPVWPCAYLKSRNGFNGYTSDSVRENRKRIIDLEVDADLLLILFGVEDIAEGKRPVAA